MKLIEIKNLALGYDNRKIIKNLSFDVNENDFITIVGPNGSGKSTIVKGLLGLIKVMDGKIIYSDSLKKEFIGYMPQENKIDPNFPASVYEIVLSGCLNRMKNRCFYKSEEKKIVDKNLKLLKIEHLKNKSFKDLSGGERQKVLLARSLSATNKLLILDEPSNNLDFKSKKELYKIAQELNKKHNITIIMITHDLDSGGIMGNKILSLADKEILFLDKDEFLKSRGLS